MADNNNTTTNSADTLEDWMDNLVGVDTLLSGGLSGEAPTHDSTPMQVDSSTTNPLMGQRAEVNAMPFMGGNNNSSASSYTPSGEPTARPATAIAKPSDGPYTYIWRARSKLYEARDVRGGYVSNRMATSFRNTGDNRHTFAKELNSITMGKNISYSYDNYTQCCGLCEPMHDITGEENGRQTYILSDQCFPAAVPPTNAEGRCEGKCLIIIRVEDGSLKELEETFWSAMRGNMPAVGSTVLIGSASYLARVGLETYAAEYVEVASTFKARLRSGSFVAHGAIIMGSGTEDTALIRAIYDLTMWQAQVSIEGAGGDYLPETMAASLELLIQHGTGPNQPEFPQRSMLPDVTDSRKKSSGAQWGA